MAALCEIRSAVKMLTFVRPSSRLSVVGKKLYSSAGGKGKGSSKTEKPSSTSTGPSGDGPDVPGLSKNVLDVPNSEVGPGAAKNTGYKNPEYFCYHAGSYFEAEVEMLKYRCPQPSALNK